MPQPDGRGISRRKAETFAIRGAATPMRGLMITGARGRRVEGQFTASTFAGTSYTTVLGTFIKSGAGQYLRFPAYKLSAANASETPVAKSFYPSVTVVDGNGAVFDLFDWVVDPAQPYLDVALPDNIAGGQLTVLTYWPASNGDLLPMVGQGQALISLLNGKNEGILAGWDGVAGTGSTTSSIVLTSGSSTANRYVGQSILVGSEYSTVTAYNTTSKAATIDPPVTTVTSGSTLVSVSGDYRSVLASGSYVPTVTAGQNLMGPLAVIGPSRGQLSVAIYGSSTPAGTGDTGLLGFAVRALINQTTTTPSDFLGDGSTAWINCSLASETASAETEKNLKRTLDFASGVDWALVDSGANDVYNGLSLSAVQAAMRGIYFRIGRRTLRRTIVAVTLNPRTTSSDGWATTENQTVVSGNNVRNGVNQWLLDESSNGAVSQLAAYGVTLKVFDRNALVEQEGTGKWLVNGVGGYATDDGIHMKPAFHALTAQYLRISLRAWSLISATE